MASWILVPCLVSLRNEFNQLAPNRDKASDGSIGDPRHAANSSDHNPDETGNTPTKDADGTNEVHAIDVDINLRKAGWTMTRAVEIIVMRHRRGEDDRLQNVIYNRTIWSRSWGWTAREYTGSNAHTQHAHFSARYTTAQERDTRPWGLIPKEPRTVKFEYFNAHLPVIPYGHNDADGIVGEDGDRDDTTYVRRAQRALMIEADGDYGPKTKAAIADLGIPGRDGTVIDLEVWERLYALWGARKTAEKAA